jgi:hypothetical protein
MITICKNQKGITSLIVIAGMVLVGFMGLGVAQVMTASQEIRLRHILYQKAYYINQAGLEYSVRKVWESVSSNVPAPGINFAGGVFTSNRNGNIITVTSNLGEAQVVHQITSPTQADCMTIDNSQVDISGGQDDKVGKIKFQKICLTNIVIDQLVVSWTPDTGEQLDEVKILSNRYTIFPTTGSGQTTDLTPDYTLTNSGIYEINPLHFPPYDMTGKSMTVDFIMGDGSVMSTSFSTVGL